MSKFDFHKKKKYSLLGKIIARYLMEGNLDDYFAIKSEIEKEPSFFEDSNLENLYNLIEEQKDNNLIKDDNEIIQKSAKLFKLFIQQFNSAFDKVKDQYQRKINGLKRYVKEMEDTSRIIGRQNLVLSYFYQAGQMLSSSFDYDHILSSIVEMISTIFNDSICCLLLRENNKLQVYSDGRSEMEKFAKYFNENIQMSINQGCEGESVSEQLPCQIFDTSTDPKYKDFRHFAKVFNFQSILAVPLIVKGKSEGCISIYSPERRFFPDEEIRILTMFSGQAARALENAQLYQQTDEKLKLRLRELSLRHDIDKAIINNEKFSSISRILLSGMEQVFPGFGFAIELTRLEPDVVMWNKDFEKVSIRRETLVKLTNQIIKKNSISEKAIHTEEENIQMMGFPISLQDEVLGAFWICSFNNQSIDFNLKEFTRWVLAQLSIAIDKSRTLEQLIQAEKMNLLGSLLSGITHELSNPLSRILGVSETGIHSSSIRELKRYMEITRQESVRCKRIMEDYLAFSRKYKASKTVVLINQVLRETIQLWKYQKKTDDMKIITNLPKKLPLVKINVNRIQQVFLNLIVNAYDALSEFEGISKVLRINAEESGNKIKIFFHDNGPGISVEHFDKIFKAFFTTKSKGKGTGLGLNLSREIILEHKGNIFVENHPDGGATFIVELPITKEQLPRAKETKKLSKPIEGESILVADDDMLILKLISTYLKREGCNVETSSDGKACLKKLSEKEYDVIIIDMIMENIRGDKIVEVLSKKSPRTLKKIIICTGDVMDKKKTEYFESKGIRILYKPFELLELRGLIEQIISQ